VAVSFSDAEVQAPDEDPPPAWLEITDEEVRAAVERLPAGLAAIFRMHAFGDLSYAEIARQLGIPDGTVATRLRRARERLREILTGAMMQPIPITRSAAKASAAAQRSQTRNQRAARAA
jgi:RNA polymerase sigma-70 factor (ECF subfamily)